MLRNMAEKQRRDKLNTYISELAALLPMVSNSPKRMDKTSILRSAATFLRMNRCKFTNFNLFIFGLIRRNYRSL